jgi:hypothetical protein
LTSFESQVEAGDFTEIGAIVGVFQQGVWSSMKAFPVMDTRYTWARSIVNGLQHYVEYLVLTCTQKRFPEAKDVLLAFIAVNLKQVKKECVRTRQVQDNLKRKLDGTRLTFFPTTDAIRRAVRQAMVRLAVICKYFQGVTDVPAEFRTEALTCVVGIIAYNSFPGRCGEWCKLKAEHVSQQIQAGHCWLQCSDHKTASTYGDLGKWMPAGSAEAFRRWLELGSKNSDLFLDPVLATTAKVPPVIEM